MGLSNYFSGSPKKSIRGRTRKHAVSAATPQPHPASLPDGEEQEENIFLCLQIMKPGFSGSSFKVLQTS